VAQLFSLGDSEHSKYMNIVRQALIFALIAESIFVCLFFALGHIQGSDRDHSNLIGEAAFWFHFSAIYLLALLHFSIDAQTFVPYLAVVIFVGVVQWFLVSLCYLLLAKRFHKHDVA
jgi:ABC-type antimicrobial peptide transport system permease subunit